LYNTYRIGKSIGIENRSVISGVWGRREWRITVNEYRVSFGADKNVLGLDSGYSCTTL
jgi:hypothetical protein